MSARIAVLVVGTCALSACGGDDGAAGPGRGAGEPAVGDPAEGDREVIEPVCDDGLDDDGDGAVDEHCPCLPGTVQSCYPDVAFPHEGSCRRGVQRCDDTAPEFPEWGPCEGAELAATEICGNEIDEDCDGRDRACELGGDDDGEGVGQRGGEDDDDDDGDEAPDDGEGLDPGDQIPAALEEVFEVGSDAVARPVDFVWAVDQSDSMDDEVLLVRSRINAFADDLAASGLDYHVVMVARRFDDPDHHELCVPEPLAGPDCADSDRFRQIDQHVDSEDALEILVGSIDAIEGFFREGSLRVVVVVSDDDSDLDAWTFDALLRGRGGYDDWVFDGFVGIDDDECDDIADEGTEYVDLAAMTGGTVEHICHDWSVALDLFAGEALERAASFELDDDPDPATLEVSVQRAGGDWEPLDEGLWDLVPPRTLVLSNEAALAVGDRVRVEYGPLP